MDSESISKSLYGLNSFISAEVAVLQSLVSITLVQKNSDLDEKITFFRYWR